MIVAGTVGMKICSIILDKHKDGLKEFTKLFLTYSEAKIVYHCLRSQVTNQCLKSTTLHFSSHLMSPVEHVLFTTCHFDLLQTINQ